MAIVVRKREGENFNSLMYRFKKKIKQSGILQEARKRRFFARPVSRRKRRLAALYRAKKQEEMTLARKYGQETTSSRRR